MTNMQTKGLLTVALLLAACGAAHADVKSKAIQEVAEEVLARFGSKAGRSLPALAEKIETYVARFGEDVLPALRRVGPDAFGLVDAAGVNGARAARCWHSTARKGQPGSCAVPRPWRSSCVSGTTRPRSW